MDINEPAILTHPPAVSIRPLTVADYHKMGEVGIFGEYERVELIEGQLIAMSPVGTPHIAAVNRFNRLLIPGCRRPCYCVGPKPRSPE